VGDRVSASWKRLSEKNYTFGYPLPRKDASAPASVHASRLIRKRDEAEGRLRNPLCDLLGIEYPVIQASMAVAFCRAGRSGLQRWCAMQCWDLAVVSLSIRRSAVD
jgi:hypothetical protein